MGPVKLRSTGRHSASRTPATRKTWRKRVGFALAVVQFAAPFMAFWLCVGVTQAYELGYA